ncbi:MAG: cobalamin-dependent protein [Candidatus Firestonebacteria bacterium]
MKITLISVDGYVSLGIRYLSSKLRANGFSTRMIFLPYIVDQIFPRRAIDELYELARNSDMIGISSMAYSAKKAVQIINRLKPLKVPIVFGGVYPTTCPEECIKYSDIICRGEGEEALNEFVGRLSNGIDYRDVQNFWYKHRNDIVRNEVRAQINDLDSFPFPDYDNCEQFAWEPKNGFGQLEYRHIPGINVPFGGFTIFNIRGCPYSCTYCVNKAVQELYVGKTSIRRNSISYVMRQLDYIFGLFPRIERIRIDDDTFFVRPLSEIKEFASEYKLKHKVPFECNADPKMITEEKLDVLFDAGLRHVGMGIQSASEYINKEIFERPFNKEIFIKSAQIMNKYAPNLQVSYDFIVLNPDERKQDIMDNIQLIKKLPKPFRLSMNSMVYFPGTAAFKRAKEMGTNVEDQRFTYFGLWTRFGELRRIKADTKNKYLNTIILLSHGNINKDRYGNIPTNIFNVLTTNKIIDIFNDKLGGAVMVFLSLFKIMIRLTAKYMASWQRQFIKKTMKKLSNVS